MKILWLAPMDWFTDCACREITKNIRDKYWDKSKYDFFLRTEFMNADWYVINPNWVMKHILTTKNQTPLIAQIFWWNEDKLLECFKQLEEKYSDYFYWLELNLGCPAKTVMQNGWWSAMLKDKVRTLEIIKKIRNTIKMPFSIKTRTWINEDDLENQKQFILEASNYVDMITVHGRTVKQWYGGDIDRDFIYDIKKNTNPNCKILWNGWIKSYSDIAPLIRGEMGGCSAGTEGDSGGYLDGILIWQWAIWNPRIFTTHEKSKSELLDTILTHLDTMLGCEYFFENKTKKAWNIYYPLLSSEVIISNLSNLQPSSVSNLQLSSDSIISNLLCQFRKHLFQYVKWIDWSKEFKVEISQIKDYDRLVNRIKEFLS